MHSSFVGTDCKFQKLTAGNQCGHSQKLLTAAKMINDM